MPRPARPGVCVALDPVESPSVHGVPIRRHCCLPAGHDGLHASRNTYGDIVHEWEWTDERNVNG